MNILTIEVRDNSAIYDAAPIAPVATGQWAVRLGIRPEHIGLAAPGRDLLNVTVAVKECLGGETYLYMDTALGERIVARSAGDDTTQARQRCRLDLAAGATVFFRRGRCGTGGRVLTN